MKMTRASKQAILQARIDAFAEKEVEKRLERHKKESCQLVISSADLTEENIAKAIEAKAQRMESFIDFCMDAVDKALYEAGMC